MNKNMQLQCDLPEGVAASFRGIGFNTEMYMDGCTEVMFFHIGDGPGYQRFKNATPEAVEDFCEYYQNQIKVAQLYVANGCNPNIDEWSVLEVPVKVGHVFLSLPEDGLRKDTGV